ncbi:hypothetical protein [Chlamydia caviae]|uniref:hypothetical protein n=1 Tax=Chlamydia caviae TaxID=83557 RepID=UPI0006828EA7
MAFPISPCWHSYDLRSGSGSFSKEIAVTRKQSFQGCSSKVENIVKTHKRDAKILVNKMTYSNIWRNQAKSQILTEGKVRLDLQGFDGAKYNYQLQVGNYTVATVLISRNIANIKSISEQAYAIRKIKSGFQKSLDDSRVYHVSFISILAKNPSPSSSANDKSLSNSI